VLQDRTVWPNWAPRLKWVWNDAYGGWVRVVAPYVFLGVLLPIIINGLWEHGHKSNGIYTVEQIMTADFATTQFVRVLIAALLTMVDMLTCLQDWEFPAFSSPTDFKVVGTFMSEIDIPIFTRFFKKHFGHHKWVQPQFWECLHFRMSGKWLAYLPAFGALGVDWWYMGRTILTYIPQDFAQYERPDDCLIFTITNQSFIDSAYDKTGNILADMVSEVTYEARKGLEPDVSIHSRFCDNPAFAKYVPFAFGVGLGVAFIALVFRAEYYWDRYAERMEEEVVEKNLAVYAEDSRSSRQSRSLIRL